MECVDFDLIDCVSFECFFGMWWVDVFLCEYVWEYFIEVEGCVVVWLCFEFLRFGGWLRCVVFDVNFFDVEY